MKREQRGRFRVVDVEDASMFEYALGDYLVGCERCD
jgi:hypothetical protein